MRTHTTKTLKDLVLIGMDPDKYQMNAQEMDVWLQTLPEITKEMFETMHFLTCHLFNKGMVGRQLGQIHKECIYLLDKLDKMGVLQAEMEALRLALINCLDHIVEKLLADYAKYLEFDYLMPVLHLRREQVKVQADLNALKVYFDALGVPVKFQKVILEGMQDILKGSRCMYERMQYIKALQEGILQLCKGSHKSCIEASLMKFLVERNYNSEAFINSYIKWIGDSLAELTEEGDQLNYLRQQERDLAIRPYRKSVYCYDHKRTRAKDLLYGFVTKELGMREHKAAERQRVELEAFRASQAAKAAAEARYSKSKKKGSVERSGAAGALVSDMPVLGYKIRTPMTVDMLAYFIKLMVQTKVIEPGVKSELLSFMAGIFQTPGTGLEGIAAGSLSVKYRQVVHTTAKSVRVLVSKMLKDIDDEFEMG